jgi:hypothetical protein
MSNAEAQSSSNPAVRGGKEYRLRDSLTAGPAQEKFSFGTSTDVGLMCDWNGDGTDEPVVFRDSSATWFLQDGFKEGSAAKSFTYGQSGDTPVCGDWDNDGVDTPGVVRDDDWRLRNSNDSGSADVPVFEYGAPTNTPVVGDWDGDGDDTAGIHRSSDGKFALRDSNDPGPGDHTYTFGTGSETPIVGDWDGDGDDTAGIVPDDKWLLSNDHSPGTADDKFGYGTSSDTPIVWDGVLPTSTSDDGVGSGPDLTTPGPDLRSAEIIQFKAGDGKREQVEFCYDDTVSSISNSSAFELSNFDSDDQIASPANAAVSSASQKCVKVEYSDETFLPEYTLAVDEGGAVAGSGGSNSPINGVPLTSNPQTNFEGRTAGPDLLDVEADPSLNQATYIFDQQVDDDAAQIDLTRLGFYDTTGGSGGRTSGGSLVGVSVNEVTIDFSNTGGTVSDAERFFNGLHAVQDTDVGTNDDSPAGHVGSITGSPDLVNVEQNAATAKNEFDFAFEEELDGSSITATGFTVFADCGEQDGDARPASGAVADSGPECTPDVSGSGATLLPDDKTVRVAFDPPVGTSDFPNEEITRGTVAEGAATARTAPKKDNTVGSQPISMPDQGPGFSDGPDLVDAQYDDASDRVTFVFDETLRQDTSDANPDGAALVSSSGAYSCSTGVVDITDNELKAAFSPGSVTGAEGAIVYNDKAGGGDDPCNLAAGDKFVVDEFGSTVSDANGNSPTGIGR